MRSLSRWPACLGMVLLLGCTATPTRIDSGYPPQAARAIVIVVDGAGGYQSAPRAVATAVSQAGLPLHVSSFDWTHGRGRWLADEVDQAHSIEQAQRLAGEVCCYRRMYPGVPVSLLAYSAGAVVALQAAGTLPPDSLDRIVLLAPAVAPDFDLRPALWSARRGIEVFTSERDFVRLGLATRVVGTADGKYGPAAGLTGFDAPADACLAARLHQHPWDRCVTWTGNRGDHAGGLRVDYLKAYVLPLLVLPDNRAAGTAPPGCS